MRRHLRAAGAKWHPPADPPLCTARLASVVGAAEADIARWRNLSPGPSDQRVKSPDDVSGAELGSNSAGALVGNYFLSPNFLCLGATASVTRGRSRSGINDSYRDLTAQASWPHVRSKPTRALQPSLQGRSN